MSDPLQTRRRSGSFQGLAGSDASVEKVELRRRVRAALAAVTLEERATWSAAICARVMASHWYTFARRILLFSPSTTEVDVGVIALAAAQEGKQVYVPRMNWDDATMIPALVSDWTTGAPGGWMLRRFGICEPGQDAPTCEAGAIDLFIVPGLAFDAHGNRIGRGAGFYDRFLGAIRTAKSSPRGEKIGVAFDCQLVDTVPTNARDVRMDGVVTPTRTIAPVDHAPADGSPEALPDALPDASDPGPTSARV
ncbi:MAG: 5-formyltetrahydrofolate cyclo-ligase [Planctomycetota bacterium]|nr:5-formyltetrahydrofolate cyclo-ligase [Planctomycetota bacterium]